MKKNRLNIIVFSKTDARKKTANLSISRFGIALILCAVTAVVIACAGFAVLSAVNASASANELEILQQKLGS